MYNYKKVLTNMIHLDKIDLGKMPYLCTGLLHSICQASFKQMLFALTNIYDPLTDKIKYHTNYSCEQKVIYFKM